MAPAYWWAAIHASSWRRSKATLGWMMHTYLPSKVGAFIFFSWVAALATSSLVMRQSLSSVMRLVTSVLVPSLPILGA